jgi:glutamate N-acetyltransferase/amino-acid N-acetyltransferase
MKKLLRSSELYVRLDLKEGKEHSIGWGADLTTDYVMFNSVYTT